jgi:hypothetical protein
MVASEDSRGDDRFYALGVMARDRLLVLAMKTYVRSLFPPTKSNSRLFFFSKFIIA